MKTSKEGCYLSAVDRHNTLGEGKDAQVCLYLDPALGELIICNKPLTTWKSIISIPVTNNQELVAALTEVLKKLSKEK